MYEDNRRFSWTNLFIKLIIVVIFILFTVWLISLSTKSITKGMSNSLGVLTDGIFSQNVDKMKNVGKSYFTTERLPEKIGEVKTLSLAKMYSENLILELKDKNGNICSAKNSYVSVEKLENEYQMKVYLDCGGESDYIIEIMGCYNYCNTDICEKKPIEVPANKLLEYEYSKTTGGTWGPYGNWSEWSKVSVTKNNYREVETKVVREDYTYDKKVTKTIKTGNATCPNISGYTLSSSNNGICSYTRINTEVTDPVSCASTYNGYRLVSQDAFTCNYAKNVKETANPLSCADTYNGYRLVSQDGFTCNYSKTEKETTSPVSCASTYNDYYLVSQNGFTCNYAKNVNETTSPVSCASTYDGYSLTSQNGFTCNYSKTTTDSRRATSSGGDPIYGQSCSQVVVGYDTTRPCAGCGTQMVPIYGTSCSTTITGYTSVTYSCPSGYTRSGTTCTKSVTTTTTTTVGCPSGYSKSGNSCVNSSTRTAITTVGCPSGYSKSGNSCVKNSTRTTTTSVGCPSGYSKSGNSCVKNSTRTTTTTVGCPSGYSKSGDTCIRNISTTKTANAICPSGETMKNGECFKNVVETEKVTETRNVTYYRYRLREYTGGTVDYKWSLSDHDQDLINAGYKLTGKTREIVGGK